MLLVCCFDTGHVFDHVLVQRLFSVPKRNKTKTGIIIMISNKKQE